MSVEDVVTGEDEDDEEELVLPGLQSLARHTLARYPSYSTCTPYFCGSRQTAYNVYNAHVHFPKENG